VYDTSRSPFPPSVLRYAGLAGAVLLVLASLTVRHRWTAIPLWLAGTLVVAAAWLLLGRRLDTVRPRWLLVTGALWAVPLLLSRPLASNDVYAYACQGSLVRAGIDPYAHGVNALPCPWIGHMGPLWRGTPSPYGPLWLVITGGAASTGSLSAAVAVLRIVALAGLALLGLTGYRLAVRLGVDPLRAAWLALLNPLVLVHALSGAHNDALMAGLLVAALLVATARGRPVPVALGVGVLVALAVGVKATALVALPFLVLLAARDRSWWTLVRTGLVTLAGLAGGYAVLWATTGYGLGWVPALKNATPLIIEWTSVPTGVGLAIGRTLKALGLTEIGRHAVGGVRAVGVLVLLVALVGIWLWARRRDSQREIVLATGVAMAAEVVLMPVAFPWYALAPVAMLGYGLADDRVRWWVGVVTVPLALLILPSGNGLASMYKVPGGILDSAIVLAALVLGVRYLRRRRGVPVTEPVAQP
jgi:hypothetical protein